jgi:Zinc carboxypeptidase
MMVLAVELLVVSSKSKKRFAITAAWIGTILAFTQAQKDESFVVTPYKYLDSQAISTLINELREKYPTLVEIDTSQRLYGLPSAGTQKDCPFDSSKKGCVNWIITIYDRIKHNKETSQQSFNELPTVLLSGALHGDERVGPTTVMEVAILLLEAAQCENKIFYDECREELQRKGIQDDRTRRWLARLVATRRIIIVPSANALGYYRNEREEDGIDPNRDFPYDVVDTSQCMQTVAGRTLNEVFRNYLIQLSFTFHGGMEAIGYEWGAPSYLNKGPSPDDAAQVTLASRYSWYGGLVNNRKYPVGDMNSLGKFFFCIICQIACKSNILSS